MMTMEELWTCLTRCVNFKSIYFRLFSSHICYKCNKHTNTQSSARHSAIVCAWTVRMKWVVIQVVSSSSFSSLRRWNILDLEVTNKLEQIFMRMKSSTVLLVRCLLLFNRTLITLLPAGFNHPTNSTNTKLYEQFLFFF